MDKFFIADRVKVENKSITFKVDSSSKICIVYTIWSNLNYVKYLYISLVSQIKYTDFLEKCDYRIVIDEDIFPSYFKYFGNLVPLEKIIVKSRDQCIKYTLPKIPELKQFDLLCICDADTFFYNPTSNKIPLYSLVQAKLKDGGLLMELTDEEFFTVFYNRRHFLAKTFKSDLEYLNFYKQNQFSNSGVFANSRWYLSCFTALLPKNFDTIEYTTFSNNAIANEIYCDETVFQWYAKFLNLDIFALQSIGKVKWTSELNLDEIVLNKLYIIHTITGGNTINSNILEIINKIVYNECVLGS